MRTFIFSLESLTVTAPQAVLIRHDPVYDIAGARRLAIPAILLEGSAPSGRFQIEPDMVICDFEMDGFAKLFEKTMQNRSDYREPRIIQAETC